MEPTPLRRNAPARRRAAAATLLGSGATSFIAVAQAFVLIPLSLYYLGPRVYGAWLAAAELLVWVQVFDLGLPNLLTQKAGAAFGAGDETGVARWFTAGFTVLAVFALIVGSVAFASAPLVARWAGLTGGEAEALGGAFRAAVAASALLLVSNAIVGLARALQSTFWVNLFSVGAALTGLAVAVLLLTRGLGVWALALGLAGRAAVLLAGLLWYLTFRVPRLLPSTWSLGRGELRETVAMTPVLAGANVGYLMMNHTDIPLVATFFGPVQATVYTLTRKAAEALRTLLDTFGYAAYGGFAHLVASTDRRRSRAVLSEVTTLRWAAAAVAAGCYVALNEPFVALLFGRETFGGLDLTIAFGLLIVIGGQSFLLNYLYRAAGAVHQGSHLLLQESLLRTGAMVVGLQVFGLVGAPAAAAAASLAYAWINWRRLVAIVPAEEGPGPGRPSHRQVVPSLCFAAGVALGAVGVEPSWPAVLSTGAALVLAGGLASVAADRELRTALFRGGAAWLR